jgi:hypothetical protein
MVAAMNTPKKKPRMEPRELRDGTGWYVLVHWGDYPSEQVGGFPNEDEAKQWIAQSAAGWLRARFEETSFS